LNISTYYSQCTIRNSPRAAGFDFILIDTSGNSNPETQPPTYPPTPTNMSTAQPGSAHINPVDDDTPDETPGTTDPNAEATAFAKAINKIVRVNYSFSKPKLQEPEPLNSSDSHKLHTFILQCKLNF